VVVALGLFAVVGLSGCGGTTSVSGKVTHAGKSVVWGSVQLVDSSGQFYQGTIGPDGTYKIDNVPVGSVRIGVMSPKPPEEKPGKGGKTAPGAGGGKGGAQASGGAEDPRAKFLREQGITPDQPLQPPPPGAWFPIPDKYNDPASSGLTGTVTPGKPLDIDIPK